jgi:hypothetical protein
MSSFNNNNNNNNIIINNNNNNNTNNIIQTTTNNITITNPDIDLIPSENSLINTNNNEIFSTNYFPSPNITISTSSQKPKEKISISQIQSHLNEEIDNPDEAEILTTNLDNYLETVAFLINNEKSKLKNDKLNLLKSKEEFKEKCQKQILHHEKELVNFSQSLEIAKKLECEDDEIIDLNIGGTEKISTNKRNLIKFPNSALAKMFSGRHKLIKHENRIFIDRDGKTFLLLLSYLRNDEIPNFENEKIKENFIEELDFWQIPFNDVNNKNNNLNINKEIKLKSVFNFDRNWCAETLNIENNGKIIKKQNIQHGIVFCTPQFSEKNFYIEFKIVINIPCRGKSHLFLGLVDKTNYRYENLLSTFWKDCPSSFYWDVWNTKLIKTDQNGIQVGTLSGYGCQCQDNETKLAICYNYKMKTIEFYKNNSNIGIAFRNVPPGLTPSLDIWFESGTVEILNSVAPGDFNYL